MYKGVPSFFKKLVTVFGIVMMGAGLLILRYILKTPQPLESGLAGEANLYKGTYGYVYYKVSGPVEASPMVLLHAPGIGASAYEMRGIMARLAQNYRVYALDWPGFGLSDHLPIDYTAATYIALLQDFLISVVGRPALVLASGLSGNYSIIVAQQQPTLCEGLVLLTQPIVPVLSVRKQLLTFIAQLPFLRIALYSLLSMHSVLQVLVARDHQVVDVETRNEIVAHRFAAAHQLHAYRAAVAYLAGKLDTADMTVSLSALQQPTLHVWKMSHDKNKQGIQEMVTPEVSGVKGVLLPAAGTVLHEEQPEVVVKRILEWQKSLSEPEEQVEVHRNARE